MSKAQASASSFGALKEEFLLNKYITGLQAENIKARWIQILFNRMECMSDYMLLKTIRELSESGALETGISTILIRAGLPVEGLQSSLGHRPTPNQVKRWGSCWRQWST
jgi:hypothetical protein